MNDFDKFARQLIEESKRFLEIAEKCAYSSGTQAYIHSALLLGFCSLEAHINGIVDDFADRTDLTLLEKSILFEEDYKLIGGAFQLNKQLKIYRMEDRLEFLFRKFSGKPLPKDTVWWSDFKQGLKQRNRLTHPKDIHNISIDEAKRVLLSIIELLNQLYLTIYNRSYPSYSRGLQSTLDFE